MGSLFSPSPPPEPDENPELPQTSQTPDRFELTPEEKDKQRRESLLSQQENIKSLKARSPLSLRESYGTIEQDAEAYRSLLSGND